MYKLIPPASIYMFFVLFFVRIGKKKTRSERRQTRAPEGRKKKKQVELIVCEKPRNWFSGTSRFFFIPVLLFPSLFTKARKKSIILNHGFLLSITQRILFVSHLSRCSAPPRFCCVPFLRFPTTKWRLVKCETFSFRSLFFFSPPTRLAARKTKKDTQKKKVKHTRVVTFLPHITSCQSFSY